MRNEGELLAAAARQLVSSRRRARIVDDLARAISAGRRRLMRTCRDAVLDAIARFERRHGRRHLSLQQIVAETLTGAGRSRPAMSRIGKSASSQG